MLAQQTDFARATSLLAEMADAWARAADVRAAIGSMLDRDDAAATLEAYVKLVWSEGLLAGLKGLSVAEIAQAARLLPPFEGSPFVA